MSQPDCGLPPPCSPPLPVPWKGNAAICFPSQGVQNYYSLKKVGGGGFY